MHACVASEATPISLSVSVHSQSTVHCMLSTAVLFVLTEFCAIGVNYYRPLTDRNSELSLAEMSSRDHTVFSCTDPGSQLS